MVLLQDNHKKINLTGILHEIKNQLRRNTLSKQEARNILQLLQTELELKDCQFQPNLSPKSLRQIDESLQAFNSHSASKSPNKGAPQGSPLRSPQNHPPESRSHSKHFSPHPDAGQ